MKLLAVLAVLGLLAIPSFAIQKDEYCSLMYAIYGCCSEQLIDNYLFQTAKTPPQRAQVIPQKAIGATVLPYSPAIGNSEGPNVTEEAKPTCWYYTPAGWKACRMVS